jgi:DNA-binding CsgD family transcriptional regulator
MGPQATADLAMTAASELTGPDLDGRQPAVQAGAGLHDPDASTRRRNTATSRDAAPAAYDDTDTSTPRRNTTTSRQRAKTAHDAAPAAYDDTDAPAPRRNTTTSRQRAKTARDAAPAAYEEIGASGDAARVRGETGRSPVRASLTDTERTVSELVAQGLTNRQVADRLFITPHTVAFHLRQVFRKLNIGSRGELTRLALRRTA